MKIVVLAGGISTERSVSIVSGTEVCKALRSRGEQAILLDVYCGTEQVDAKTAFTDIHDIEADVAYIHSFDEKIPEMIRFKKEFFGPQILEICKAADVVFLALHGADGENGKVQAAFDLFGIRYTGTGYLSSALSMDKALSKELLHYAGVPVPMGRKITSADAEGLADMALPLVVKPCCGGSSVGVSIVQDKKDLQAALDEAFRYESEVVVEEYIAGRDRRGSPADHRDRANRRLLRLQKQIFQGCDQRILSGPSYRGRDEKNAGVCRCRRKGARHHRLWPSGLPDEGKQRYVLP